MINLSFLLFLAAGTLAMWIPMLFMCRSYRIPVWKSPIIAVLLTLAGTIGTYLWFALENSFFGGTSFIGAIVFVPLAFLGIAKLLRVPYPYLMDFCAPAECIMLVLMKINCFRSGCCGGRELYVSAEGVSVYFPSQIAEAVNALLVFAVLMILAYRRKQRGLIYLWYLVLYGATRFILNWFRDGLTPFLIYLPIGNFWALCSLIVGTLMLVRVKRKMAEEASSACEIQKLDS